MFQWAQVQWLLVLIPILLVYGTYKYWRPGHHHLSQILTSKNNNCHYSRYNIPSCTVLVIFFQSEPETPSQKKANAIAKSFKSPFDKVSCQWCMDCSTCQDVSYIKWEGISHLFDVNINPLSPHDALKHHFISLKTDLIFLQLTVLKGKFSWNSFTNTWRFPLICHPL